MNNTKYTNNAKSSSSLEHSDFFIHYTIYCTCTNTQTLKLAMQKAHNMQRTHHGDRNVALRWSKFSQDMERLQREKPKPALRWCVLVPG